MNTETKKKYLSYVCDEMRKHSDGSICKAKSPETCPFNKKAERADSIHGGESSEYAKMSLEELGKTIHEALRDYYLEGEFQWTKEDDFWEDPDPARDSDPEIDAMMTEYEKKVDDLWKKRDYKSLYGDRYSDIICCFRSPSYPFASGFSGRKYENDKRPGLYPNEVPWFESEAEARKYIKDCDIANDPSQKAKYYDFDSNK